MNELCEGHLKIVGGGGKLILPSGCPSDNFGCPSDNFGFLAYFEH